MPQPPHAAPESDPVHAKRLLESPDRRSFLLIGAGMLLAGCSTNTSTLVSLPSPAWDTDTRPATDYEPASTPVPAPAHEIGLPGGVMARSQWARGNMVPALMKRMAPVNRITIHHDGGATPFTSVSQAGAADRLETIRKGHRGSGWGDIGYHFAIDPAGRVWQGRPVLYQGAHVKDHNEGNIGVVVLGNFESQTPNNHQLHSLQRFVATLRRNYNVSPSNVRTHRELGPTVCPGRNLQPRIVAMRSNGGFA